MTTSRFISRAACLGAALALIGGSAAFAQAASTGDPATSGTTGAGSQTMGTGSQTTGTMPGMSTGTSTGTGMTPGMSTGAMSPSATLNDTDKLFMLRAAQGDMAEISTGQMALKKAKLDQTKQVAQTIIMGHSASLKEGMGLAVLLGLQSPKGPNVADMAMAQKLSASGGKDFDKQYLAGQQVDHENTIALFGMEMSQGQDPQVKAFAAKYLPGIEGHTAQIYQAALSVGAPDSSLRPTTPPMVTGVAPSSMADMNSTSGMSNGTSGMSNGTSGMSGGASGTTGSTGTGGTMGTGAGTANTGAGTDTTGSTGKTSGTGTGAGTATPTPGQ